MANISTNDPKGSQAQNQALYTGANPIATADNAAKLASLSGDIGIVFLGDSHTQGVMTALTLPLHDKATYDWATTAWNYYQRTVNWITDLDNIIDPNAASTGSLPSYSVLAVQRLRQCAQLGRVRSANVGLGGSSTYTWGPVQARAYIQVATLPADGDTFTIGSQVYTYRTSATAPYDILIGADIAAARLQTSRVISGEGADVVAGTDPHPLVYSPNPANTQYRSIFAVESGAAGNAITMSSAQASIVCLSAGLAPASTLGGGVDGATAFFTDNLTVNIPSAFGTVDYVVITLGTNDVARIGWRARGFAAEAAKIIALIRARWPLAKIIWVNPGATSLSDRNTLLETIVAPALDALETAGQIYTVDMYTATGSAAILSGDGVHYTDYGYGVLAQLVADKIIETL